MQENLDLIRLSLKNLARRPVRSLLTIAGIAVGMTAAVALFALSSGAQRALSQQLDRLGHDLILVLPAPSAQSAPEQTFQINNFNIGQIMGVTHSGSVLKKTLAIKSQSATGFLTTFGLSESTFDFAERFFQKFQLAEGRLPAPNSQELLITQGILRLFNLQLGDSIQIEQENFLVSGLLAATSDQELENALFMPIESLWKLKNTSNEASFVWVKSASQAEMKPIESELKALFASARIDVNVQSPARLGEVVDGVLSLISTAFGAMAAVAILAGCLGLANTMLMATIERRHEIGILVALGARRGQIIKIFLVEAGALGMAGGLLGAIFGSGLASSLVMLIGPLINIGLLTPDLDLFLMLLVLFISTALGMISGAIPASRASQLRPSDALRAE